NDGGLPATTMADGLGLVAPFSFKGGSYPGTGGDCGAGLGIGATCNIVVTYAPAATGAHSDTIVIDYYDGLTNQQATRDVQGSAVGAAILSISDGPTFEYGTIAVN